jgi:hypothetical protein
MNLEPEAGSYSMIPGAGQATGYLCVVIIKTGAEFVPGSASLFINDSNHFI